MCIYVLDVAPARYLRHFTFGKEILTSVAAVNIRIPTHESRLSR